jgi:hypothetical protein
LQVEQAQGQPLSQQPLLQMEARMLLTLVVLQLTAGLPAEHQAALTAQLPQFPLYSIYRSQGLHNVPLAAAYTGPQLALQVWPTPAGVGALRQEQHQEQQPPAQTGSVQSPVHCVLAPTAGFLAEVLPLLTQRCLNGLAALQEGRQQQQQQKPGAETQGSGGVAAAAAAAAVAAVNCSPDVPSVFGKAREAIDACLECLAALLYSLVVPEHTQAGATVVTGAHTVAAAAAAAYTPSTAAAYTAAAAAAAAAAPDASCSYAVHAQEISMAHVVDTLRVLEGVLRAAAAVGVTAAAWVQPEGVAKIVS